jgi:predicted nucleic acid-binding protein
MATEAVLDSSVIVALTTPEKYSEWVTKKALNYDNFHVIDLSFYEVANALESKVSARFDTKDALSASEQAEKVMQLSIVHSFQEIMTDALNIALEQKISVYDAAFLALAVKLNLKLLTLDTKLAKKLEQTKYSELVEYPDFLKIS